MHRIVVSLLAALAIGVFAGEAHAAGGSYIFDGGTMKHQAAVRAALEASSFDWNVVPATVKITIARGHNSEAVRGQIWLDADLLDGGRLSWGVVQHEYAHQVDFFLVDGARRELLSPRLGGVSWWAQQGIRLAHAQLTSERFASTLTWSYWPVADNIMRPTAPSDESAALPPAEFRSLVSEVLSIAEPTVVPSASSSPSKAPPTLKSKAQAVRLKAKSPQS
jgi:hypothetical protein